MIVAANLFHRRRWSQPHKAVQINIPQEPRGARNKLCKVQKSTTNTKLSIFCDPTTMILPLIAILLLNFLSTARADIDSSPMKLVEEQPDVATGSDVIKDQNATRGKQQQHQLLRWTRYATSSTSNVADDDDGDGDESISLPLRRDNETALAATATAIKDINIVLSNSSIITRANETEVRFNSEIERYILIVNIVAEIAVLVVGLIGNGIVIAIILFFTKGNSVADVYIFNLAIADMTFLAGLGFLFATSINDHWVFGNIMCKMFMSLTALNQFASSLLLSMMSFDRYLAVCHPIFSQRYRRPAPAKLMCCFLWILCFVLMIPILMHARTNERDNTCGIFWPDSGIHERVFTSYSFCIGFLLPLVLIVVFYRCVVIKLRSTASGPQCMSSERRNRNRESTNKRVTSLVKAIVLTYGLCWLPYWIGQMLIGFSQPDLAPQPQQQPGVEYVGPYYTFNQVAACLSYLNSAVNPVLYAFLSDSFRRRCSQFWQSILSFYLFKRWHQPPAGGCTQTSVTENHHQQHHHHNRHSRHENNNSAYCHEDDEEENIQNNNNTNKSKSKSNNINANDSLSVRQASNRTRTTTISGGTGPSSAALLEPEQQCPATGQNQLLSPIDKCHSTPLDDQSQNNNNNNKLDQQQTFRKKHILLRKFKLKRTGKKKHSLVKLNHMGCANKANGGQTVLLA